MIDIKVYPNEVWDYFVEHQAELYEDEIASNSEFGITVYLTETSDGFPEISVYLDGDELYDDYAEDPIRCYELLQQVYENFLPDGEAMKLLDGSTKEDQKDAISQREDQLYAATYNFLTDVLDVLVPEGEGFDEVIEDCMDHFLEYMARKHHLEIYRPMYLEDEDGTVSFEEYPYPQLAFDDEDNPIYR